MAVVYAVLCHHSPRHVAELVRHLWHPGHRVVLHADRKAPAALHHLLARLAAAFPDISVLDSAPCAWGGWSLVDATLRAVTHALALRAPWRHFALLSEQHMPLQPPAAIAASLPDGASFIAARPLTAMDRATRADLLHRFANRYRELPGVGMFAGPATAPDPAAQAALRLGSQWVVLARDACERLAAVGAEAALWAPFRSALVPDETALQSVLRASPVGRGLDIRDACPTFTAWPHLGGGADSGFTDTLVATARACGHLFIRKRPPVLPPRARALLAGLPARPDLPPADPPAEPPAPDVAGLAATLAGMLRGRFPQLSVQAAPPGEGPACVLRFGLADLPETLAVWLVSQDLSAFKVLLAWRRAFDGDLATIDLGGFAAPVMGARLPGLAFAREVLIPEQPEDGFVTAAGGDAGALATPLALALAVARRLAPLVAG